MRRLKAVFISVSLLLTFHSWAQVDFIRDDLSKALEKAKAERKFIMVDVYADWCGWCKKMDATTFKNEEVAQFVNSNMVALKLNSERGDGVEFARKYNVTGLPTIVYLDFRGDIVRKVPGYKSPTDLLRDIAPYKSKQKNLTMSTYFDVRSDYVDFLKTQLEIEKELGKEISQALTYGENNQVFEFDQFKAQLNQASVFDIARLDVFYLIGKGEVEQAQKKIKDDSLVGLFSKNQALFLVNTFMKYGNKEIEVLQMINEHATKSKDLNVLETKAAVQYFVGDIEDGKKTILFLEKMYKKQKLEKTNSLNTLKTLIYQ